MCVYTYIYLRVCVYMNICHILLEHAIDEHVKISSLRIYVYVYVYVYIHVYIYICVRIYICHMIASPTTLDNMCVFPENMRVFIRVYMYICMCVCI